LQAPSFGCSSGGAAGSAAAVATAAVARKSRCKPLRTLIPRPGFVDRAVSRGRRARHRLAGALFRLLLGRGRRIRRRRPDGGGRREVSLQVLENTDSAPGFFLVIPAKRAARAQRGGFEMRVFSVASQVRPQGPGLQFRRRDGALPQSIAVAVSSVGR
jgi:hypothetical protein